MSITYKIWDFPKIPISKQLFHVPGAALDGGFTSGGVSIISPEPGGRSVLEIQPSVQIGEWTAPFSSWIMSKTNGQILRVQLAFTPQVVSSDHVVRPVGVPSAGYGSGYEEPTRREIVALYGAAALEGSNVIQFDMTAFGPIVKAGHLIGHGDNCYLIDEISYNGYIATASVTPPLRKSIAIGDIVRLRPMFLGTIANGSEIRTTYDAVDWGNIQIGKITLNEFIL